MSKAKMTRAERIEAAAREFVSWAWQLPDLRGLSVGDVLGELRAALALPLTHPVDAVVAPSELGGEQSAAFWKWTHLAMSDAWQLGYDAAMGDGVEPLQAGAAQESDIAFLLHPDRLGPPPCPAPPGWASAEQVREVAREAASEGAQAAKAAVKANGGEWPVHHCDDCGGDGSVDEGEDCDACDGTGYEYDSASAMTDSLPFEDLIARVLGPKGDK